MVVEELNYEDIKHYYPDFLNEYQQFIQEFIKDPIGRMLVVTYPNKSMFDYLRLMEIEVEKRTSYILFPGHQISFYPSIKQHKNKNYRLCHFSGKTIDIGEIYYHYRPLIIDETIHKKYVLDPSIILKQEYGDILPTTLSQFEHFIHEAKYSEDYSEFRTQYSEEITLKELNKKKLYLK